MEVLLYVGLMLLPAILTYYLAKRKGRESIGMFFIGLFFGIFGIIYAAAMKHLNNLNRSLNGQILEKAKEEGYINGSYIYALPIDDITRDWKKIYTAIINAIEEQDYVVNQSYTRDKLFITVGDSGFIQMVPKIQNNVKILNVFSFNAGSIDLSSISTQIASEEITDPSSLPEIPLLFLDEDSEFSQTPVNSGSWFDIKKAAAIALIPVAGYAFYYFQDDDITCDHQVVQELVEQIAVPQIKDQYTLMVFSEMQDDNKMGALGATYALQMAKTAYGDDEALLEEKVEGYKEAKAKAEEDLHDYSFLLKSFRTTALDKDLQKVECKAILQFNQAEIDVEYSGQYTDDKSEVYVELTHIDL